MTPLRPRPPAESTDLITDQRKTGDTYERREIGELVGTVLHDPKYHRLKGCSQHCLARSGSQSRPLFGALKRAGRPWSHCDSSSKRNLGPQTEPWIVHFISYAICGIRKPHTVTRAPQSRRLVPSLFDVHPLPNHVKAARETLLR